MICHATCPENKLWSHFLRPVISWRVGSFDLIYGYFCRKDGDFTQAEKATTQTFVIYSGQGDRLRKQSCLSEVPFRLHVTYFTIFLLETLRFMKTTSPSTLFKCLRLRACVSVCQCIWLGMWVMKCFPTCETQTKSSLDLFQILLFLSL